MPISRDRLAQLLTLACGRLADIGLSDDLGEEGMRKKAQVTYFAIRREFTIEEESYFPSDPDVWNV